MGTEAPAPAGLRPVFARYPRLRDRVPFEPLAALPSPVTERDGVWVKRDDLAGGGKLRKLEFFHPEGPVVAIGSEGSNWLKALARHRPGARIHGWPQAHNEDSRRNAAGLAGTRDRDLFLFGLRVLGELPRVLGGAALAPIGGSDPVTTLGFVNAALELAGQVEAGELPRPDAVFVPLGTAGTAAGLALGLALAGMGDTVLHAVRIVGGLMSTERQLRRLLQPAAWLLDEAPRSCRLVVEEGFLGPGYARPTPASRAAQAWAAPLRLDASYVSKAAACLLARRSAYRHPLLWLTSPPEDEKPVTSGSPGAIS